MFAAPLPEWLREIPDGTRVALRVVPRAGADSVDEPREGRLRVRVTAAPADGKANAAVCKLLAKRLGTAKSNVSVVSGALAREKIVEVSGMKPGEVRDALAP